MVLASNKTEERLKIPAVSNGETSVHEGGSPTIQFIRVSTQVIFDSYWSRRCTGNYD